MTNKEIAAMLASLQQQMAAIAAATLPPPPVVQSQAARDWLPNIAVVVGDLNVVDVFNNRDDAFAARASLAKLDASNIYRVLPECRDDSGVACSVVVARAREAVAA
jgi:hypothetical protein